MDLGTFAAALRRRWYLVALATLIAVGAAYATAVQVGPTYRAEGSTLLLPPSFPERPDPGSTKERRGNPYLELGGLTTARDIVIRAMSSQSAGDALAEEVPSARYEVTPDPSSSGPVILTTVTADTPGHATTALGSLLDSVPQTLGTLQDELSIAGTAQITARTLTVDSRPEPVRKSQVRAAIVTGAGALAVMVLLIGALDGLMRRRLTPSAPVKALRRDPRRHSGRAS